MPAPIRLPATEIFTRADALEIGMSAKDLTRLVRAGAIARLAHGVYRSGGGAVLDPAGISRSMKVVISDESAAAWWGANLPHAPEVLYATAPRNRRQRQTCPRGLRLHRADLRPDEIDQSGGAIVTTPTRTVLDVARSKPLPEALAIGDSMCRLGLTTAAEIEQAALALPRGPGRPKAVRVASLIDPKAESVFESISRARIAMAGLALPTSQVNVFSASGVWIGRVDFAWETLRLILECDGFEYHRNRESFERDRRRWTALTRAGWRVVVITWNDVIGDPAYFDEVMTDLIGGSQSIWTHNPAAKRQSRAWVHPNRAELCVQMGQVARSGVDWAFGGGKRLDVGQPVTGGDDLGTHCDRRLFGRAAAECEPDR
jgi:Transcriptional regulator, AbiEi antitoxin/Protein of unknown function (DUF559)